MATQVTFIWEETPEMTYDQMMDNLMFMGADDIETEEIDLPEPTPPSESQRKKKK